MAVLVPENKTSNQIQDTQGFQTSTYLHTKVIMSYNDNDNVRPSSLSPDTMGIKLMN